MARIRIEIKGDGERRGKKKEKKREKEESRRRRRKGGRGNFLGSSGSKRSKSKEVGLGEPM